MNADNFSEADDTFDPDGTLPAEFNADEGELDITFDDAPEQVKPTIAKAPKAPKVARAKREPQVVAVKHANAPKPKVTRKPTVAKAAIATAKSKHRVETVDGNKLPQYLDKLVNDDGYTLISVTGSSSIMGAFAVVSVKVG